MKKEKDPLHVAEQDNLIEYIYHILWRKSPLFGHSSWCAYI